MVLNAIRRTIIGLGCALSVVLSSAGARADGSPRPSVVVVRPDTTDPRLAEALTRIEAELRIAGFEVTIAAKPGDADAQSAAPSAVIAISGDAAIGLEFGIEDRRTGRTVIRRMAPEGETGKRAPEILAVYAVELLLASLAELDITPASPQMQAPPPPPPVTASVAPEQRPIPPAAAPAETKPPRIGFESGLGVAVSRVGTAVLPVVRFQYAPLPAVQLRLTGAGLGTRPQITGEAGTARVAQGIVLAEALARPYKGRWVSPKLSLGAGAHYFGVEGRAAPPLEGQSASLWSFALDFGVGLSSARSSLFEFALEAHALFAYPYPSVRFVDEQQATSGRPTVILTATVVGWL